MAVSDDEAQVLDQWSHRLAQALQILDLKVDQALLLDLARESAGSVIHAAAPVTTFLVGYAAGLDAGSGSAGSREVLRCRSGKGRPHCVPALQPRARRRPGRGRLGRYRAVERCAPCRPARIFRASACAGPPGRSGAPRRRPRLPCCPRSRPEWINPRLGESCSGNCHLGRDVVGPVQRHPELPHEWLPGQRVAAGSDAWNRYPAAVGSSSSAVTGSRRTITAFDTGVWLPSATLSSGTRTFASG